MKTKKDCMFQYALAKSWKDRVIEDTGLITRKKAEELWNKYYPDFISKLEGGYEPEMAIWINCKTPTNYHEDVKHLDYRDDLVVRNGIIYQRFEKPIK